jgi:hypothetical protein
VQVPVDTVREVGNDEVVDKVPTEPSFTFSLTSWDVTTEIEAWLGGLVAAGTGSAQAADLGLPDGHEFRWADCQFVNVVSPWKDPTSGSAGVVDHGHLVPGFYPTRISYSFGVTAAAEEVVELSGGSYYYAAGAPVEQEEVGDGSTVAFATDDAAIPYRRGGAEGSTFKSIFGIIVDGQIQIEGVDYTQTDTGAGPAVQTVTFTVAPANGAKIRFAYFSNVDKAFPQAVHASTVVKPAEVRGRNICIFLGSGGSRQKVGSVQQFTLEATVNGDFEREFCNEETIGYTINGRDTTGTMTVRSKDRAAFLALASKVTGVPASEVIGWLNTHSIPLECQIQNPKNPGQILKTLYVPDAIFQTPGTPAQVNQPTDFAFTWGAKNGTYSAFKGAKP